MVRPGLWARDERTAAVAELFVAHHRRLVGLASLLVDDQGGAEEVVQEAFLALYRRWRLLRDPTSAVAYLNRCVVNGGRKRLQQRRRLASLVPMVAVSTEPLPSAEYDAIAHQEAERVLAVLRELPRRQREVLVLRYYLDQSEAEIAEALGISPGSVKTHASRGLAALARRLEGEP